MDYTIFLQMTVGSFGVGVFLNTKVCLAWDGWLGL